MAVFSDAVRISVHLPTYDAAHIQAAEQVATYYKYRLGGSTTSLINNAPFTGAWPYLVHGKNGPYTRLYDSRVCILVIDIVLSAQIGRNNASQHVDDIKRKAVAAYQAFGCKQKAFWITLTDLQIAV